MRKNFWKIYFLFCLNFNIFIFAGEGKICNEQYENFVFEKNNVIEVFPDKKENEEKKRKENLALKSLGRNTRKKVHLLRLNRLIRCASALVEDQYGGYTSSLQGLSIFNALSECLEGESYEYEFLANKCSKILAGYRKRVLKKEEVSRALTEDEKNKYLAEVVLRFPEKINILTIARQAVNSVLVCRRAIGFHMEGGLGFVSGFGGDHYSCWSPLGRKIHLSGPTVSAGVGFGLNINIGGGQDYNILTPLHNLKNLVVTHAESQAVAIGFSKVEGTKDTFKQADKKVVSEQKNPKQTFSREGTLGVGWQKVTRRTEFLKSVGFHNAFKETGLYDLLGVPVQIHF